MKNHLRCAAITGGQDRTHTPTHTVFTLGCSRSFDHGLDNCRLMAVEFWLLSLLTVGRDKMETQVICKSINMFSN